MKKITFHYPMNTSFTTKSNNTKKDISFIHSLIVMLFVLLFNHSIQASSLPEKLQKVGEGTMSWMFLDIYRASLFTSTGTYNEGIYPQALTINYLKNINKNSLIEATEEQWLLQNVEQTKLNNWLQLLDQIWPDINKGDSLTFYVPGTKEGYFYHNQTLVGRINSDGFSDAFLNIWLSEKTSQPKLRRQLLALK